MERFRDTTIIIREELPFLWKTQPFIFILAIPAMFLVIPVCFIGELLNRRVN